MELFPMKHYFPLIISSILMSVFHFVLHWDEPLLHWVLGVIGTVWTMDSYYTEVIRRLNPK